MEVMAEKPNKIAKKLRWLMELGKLTQAGLAEIAGVHPTTIGTYMDKAVPGAGVLLKIARHFQVPMEWLADDDQDVEDFNDAAIAALARYPDDKIIAFVSHRWGDACKRLVDQIEKVEAVDWPKIAGEVKAILERFTRENKPRPQVTFKDGRMQLTGDLPKHIRAAIELVLALGPMPTTTVDLYRIMDQWADYTRQILERYYKIMSSVAAQDAPAGMLGYMPLLRMRK